MRDDKLLLSFGLVLVIICPMYNRFNKLTSSFRYTHTHMLRLRRELVKMTVRVPMALRLKRAKHSFS